TGIGSGSVELSGKRLELHKEAVTAIVRVAVPSHPDNPNTGTALQEVQAVARQLGVQLQSLSMRDPGELEGILAAMSKDKAEALVMIPAAPFDIHRARINELAARSRLPTIWAELDAVAAGALMAY